MFKNAKQLILTCALKGSLTTHVLSADLMATQLSLTCFAASHWVIQV